MKANRWAGVIIAFAGAAMICAGVMLEQYRSVFVKAIRVCLECIGIG